ncbi:MAG: SDR family NAD(P)-dependent oxidoreductase, partial [Planctomycetes bacterium]|nr:SDR family NAD(P)-dependent oxidoreductase [Planctomycetota bacterium]
MDAQVALITGGGRGLGRELALALARCGVTIAAVDREADGLMTLEAELRRDNRPFAWELADVTDAPSMAAKVAILEEQLGPIDLLIANAGIGKETPAADFCPDDFANLVHVNLLGVANSIAAVLPGMIERRRGHIVGISSLASLYGLPRMMGYCASKAGV